MGDYVAFYLPFFVVFIVGGTAHEFCHAWSAYRLGDATSRDLGRLTLNPLMHIELFGSVLFPVFMVYVNAPFVFGWMKPVPVSYMNLRNPARDMFLVSLAGPFANLFLGFLGLIVFVVLDGMGAEIPWAVVIWIKLNLLLAFFNLLPIPPLDGSSIVDFIRKDRTGRYHSQAQMGGIVILLLLVVGGFRYLWKMVSTTMDIMITYPILPVVVYLALIVLAVIFIRKTSLKRPPSTMKRVRVGEKEIIFERANKVGRQLARKKNLSREDREWLEMIARDPGDGEMLCSPVSFRVENEFCAACPNFKRCAHRLIETIQKDAS